jgi:hypothetical protein
MVERRMNGSPGSRFTLLMLIILVVLAILVLSIHRHASTQPNSGAPPNQRLHP